MTCALAPDEGWSCLGEKRASSPVDRARALDVVDALRTRGTGKARGGRSTSASSVKGWKYGSSRRFKAKKPDKSRRSCLCGIKEVPLVFSSPVFCGAASGVSTGRYARASRRARSSASAAASTASHTGTRAFGVLPGFVTLNTQDTRSGSGDECPGYRVWRHSVRGIRRI